MHLKKYANVIDHLRRGYQFKWPDAVQKDTCAYSLCDFCIYILFKGI